MYVPAKLIARLFDGSEHEVRLFSGDPEGALKSLTKSDRRWVDVVGGSVRYEHIVALLIVDEPAGEEDHDRAINELLRDLQSRGGGTVEEVARELERRGIRRGNADRRIPPLASAGCVSVSAPGTDGSSEQRQLACRGPRHAQRSSVACSGRRLPRPATPSRNPDGAAPASGSSRALSTLWSTSGSSMLVVDRSGSIRTRCPRRGGEIPVSTHTDPNATGSDTPNAGSSSSAIRTLSSIRPSEASIRDTVPSPCETQGSPSTTTTADGVLSSSVRHSSTPAPRRPPAPGLGSPEEVHLALEMARQLALASFECRGPCRPKR